MPAFRMKVFKLPGRYLKNSIWFADRVVNIPGSAIIPGKRKGEGATSRRGERKRSRGIVNCKIIVDTKIWISFLTGKNFLKIKKF
jgi:hypothetical protein